MTEFLLLPRELLLEILKNLDHRELLKCCSVCRTLKEIIEDFVELQYIIELGAEGMVACPSELSAAERLQMLLERRQAWACLDWNLRTTVKVPGVCQAYELVGGAFAKIMPSRGELGPSRHLLCSFLPNRDSPGHQIVHEDVKLVARDFAIDPSQDLIAYLVVDHDAADHFAEHQIHVHLRTISTNASHPLAAAPVLHRKASFHVLAAFMQIVDDVVGVYILSCQLVIWNWQTSRLMVFRTGTGLPRLNSDFAFLSSRAYMITSCLGAGLITLYCFGEANSQRSVQLKMPPTRMDVEVTEFKSHSGPFTAHPMPGRPFSTSRDSRIHFFRLEYMFNESFHRYYLFAHNRTLLSYLSGEEDSVEWDTWGPRHAHFRKQFVSLQWLRYVEGQRVVFPSLLDGKVIAVFDFNINDRTLRTKPSSRNNQALDPSVQADTITSAGNIFTKNVVTHLPYRIVSRVEEVPYFGIMIDQDRLIGLQSTAMSDGPMQPLHVYIF